MTFERTVIQSIAVMIGLILLVILLRRLKVVCTDDGPLFARLVTDVTLPALIFLSLAQQALKWDQVALALAMMAAEVVCIATAWGVAQWLHLAGPQKGALILSAGFGSSTFIGYTLVRQIFSTSTQAMPDAIITSEIGVGSLIFTLGVLIAIHYGSSQQADGLQLKTVLKFFRSPIFVALALGILASAVGLPTQNVVAATLLSALDILGKANTLLVALVIGTLLEVPQIRSAALVVVAACLIKLVLQPLVAWLPATWLNFPDLWTRVLVLEAAMPSAILSAVFARRYGCDARLSSLIILSTLFVSSFSLLVVLSLLA